MLRKMKRFLKSWRARNDSYFVSTLQKYCSMTDTKEFKIEEKDFMPILNERKECAGIVDPHYFLQDIYYARKIIASGVKHHYDIGSRIDGFIAHLLSSPSTQTITQIDIRPFPVKCEKLDFIQDDATKLERFADNSIESLSSLHTIEHFGLGRYGDEIDPDAWKTVLHSMRRALRTGGILYISVPCGNTQKICFNAHRIFVPKSILEQLSGMHLISFAYIHDYEIIEVEPEQVWTIEEKLGDCDCGMFIFEKN